MRSRPLPLGPPPDQQRVFDLLLRVNDHFAVGATLRVAGGWVRDMLLGQQCHDIDVALEGPPVPEAETGEPSPGYLTGAAFARLVSRYQTEVLGEEVSSIGVIRANPGQSKHLETATKRVYGIDVDLVHLRSEDYAGGTRIPVVRAGTPLEDACRRDLTINALFYNLHTQLAEDFTGKGFDDLEGQVIRTPLEPKMTFLDDPLRVLRCVRFACKMGFNTIDPGISAALDEPEVRDALQEKVSRERVGLELEKMLAGPRPARALRLLQEYHLRPIVFCVHPLLRKRRREFEGPIEWSDGPAVEERSWQAAVALVEHAQTLAVPDAAAAGPANASGREVLAARLAALLLNVAPPADGPTGARQVESVLPWFEGLLSFSLKFPTNVAQLSCRLVVAARQAGALLRAVGAGSTTEAALGAAVTEMLAVERGPASGRVQVGEWCAFATLPWAAFTLRLAERHLQLAHDPQLASPEAATRAAALLWQAIEADPHAPHWWALRPLIRGDQLERALALPSKDVISSAVQYLLRLQIAHPDLVERKDEAALLALLRPLLDEIVADAARRTR